MPHTRSPQAAAARLARARRLGFVTPKEPGFEFIKVPTAIVHRSRAILRSICIHDNHNVIAGAPSHYARSATWKAAAHLNDKEVRTALAAHRAANRAKHQWPCAVAAHCNSSLPCSVELADDPLQLNDPWAAAAAALGRYSPVALASGRVIEDTDVWAAFRPTFAAYGGDHFSPANYVKHLAPPPCLVAAPKTASIGCQTDATQNPCGDATICKKAPPVVEESEHDSRMLPASPCDHSSLVDMTQQNNNVMVESCRNAIASKLDGLTASTTARLESMAARLANLESRQKVRSNEA